MPHCKTPDQNHWCDRHKPKDGTGIGPGFFCDYPHPDHREPREVTALDGTRQMIDAPTVFCRRIKDHDGFHRAFTRSIRVPEIWADPDEEPPF